MKEQVELVLRKLEEMDDAWREHGIPDEYREKWGVNTNVGLWICGREAGAFLHAEVLKRKPITILELGTSVGYSTIWLAAAAKEVGGHVSSIEIQDYKLKEAQQNLAEAGLENVDLIHGDIVEVLQNWSAPIDFVFMDANKRGYQKHFELIAPHLSEGAVVIADNILDMATQVESFLEYLKGDDHFNVEILDVAHGLAVIERA